MTACPSQHRGRRRSRSDGRNSGEADEAVARIVPALGGEDDGARILAAVVDEDHLSRTVETMEKRIQPVQEQRNDRLLVVDRYDEAVDDRVALRIIHVVASLWPAHAPGHYGGAVNETWNKPRINRWTGRVSQTTTNSGFRPQGRNPERRCGVPQDGEGYFTFFCTHSSITWAMSRLFFSIITMWPLPWMPLSCRRMYSVLTPAWLRYFAVQWS